MFFKREIGQLRHIAESTSAILPYLYRLACTLVSSREYIAEYFGDCGNALPRFEHGIALEGHHTIPDCLSTDLKGSGTTQE